ncbi:MAG TPA: hypothetical protein VMZ26_15385, partial [Pyrinomonadaceae bacterium]|nr:hypothetical protein [Pyrinomonadaceae bacterium]
ASVEPQVQTDTRHIVVYEDYEKGDDELNIRRPPAASDQPPPPATRRPRAVEESDLDAYERGLGKLKKPE